MVETNFQNMEAQQNSFHLENGYMRDKSWHYLFWKA